MTQAAVDSVNKLALDHGLNEVQAKAVLSQRHEAAQAVFAQVQTNFQATQREWIKEAMLHPELGNGDPATFAANSEHAKLGLQQLVPAEKMAELEKHGFGNMPWLQVIGVRYYKAVMQSPNLVGGAPVKEMRPAKVDNSLDGWAKDLYPAAPAPAPK